MMKMKKLLCAVLSAVFLFSLCSCSGTVTDENTEETTVYDENTGESGDTLQNIKSGFFLPYSKSDSFNPYKAKTQLNCEIASLLYDGLYRLDESFSPVAVIAESADVGSDAVTVSLKDSVKFSDSSPLNSSDVVYSFRQAKESERYSSLLDSVSDAVAIESFKVKFILSRADAFALNALIFPVIKYGSLQQDSPYGSGRYILSGEKLVSNREHISGEKMKIKTIGLTSLKDTVSFADALRIGNISFFFSDLSDCDIQQRASANAVPVTLNNLVYIGINSTNELLRSSAVRKAINLALDKASAVSQAYHEFAVRTESPFNPQWKETSEKKAVFNQEKAVEVLEENGFCYSSETDKYRESKNGKTLRFRILVPSNNEFRIDAANAVSKNLAQIGIDAEVVSLSFSKYKEKIKKKDFDLYLGEVKLCENMSLLPFFTKGGRVHYGINLKSDIVSSYKKLLEGKMSVSEFETAFENELPFIPVCYRKGIAFASNMLSDNIKSISGDVFFNIAQWKMS